MAGGPVLEVEGLSKRYGSTLALDGVDLTVDRGQIVALLGPNGAGKTTLMSVVARLLRADEGQVRVVGRDVRTDPAAVRQHVGIASQDVAVYPGDTVRENLRYFGRLAGVEKRALEDRIEELAPQLGLEALLERAPRDLSGGEKRRVHVAAALLHRPSLVVLDEPTAGVDIATRARLLEEVRALADAGTAVLYSSHYLPEVEQLGADVVLIDHGRVIARGAIDELAADTGRRVVEVEVDDPAALVAATAVPAGTTSECDGTVARFSTTEPVAVIAAVAAALERTGAPLHGVQVDRPNLEALFLALTADA